MNFPTLLAGYLALFAFVGFTFVFFNLAVGWLFRPKAPNAEKLEIYECGEPTIGSSFVQFDLRFYVVALLFIIFDVEVAFFFPWASVFGKATHLTDPALAVAEAAQTAPGALTPSEAALYRELGVPRADQVGLPAPAAAGADTFALDRAAVRAQARTLAWLSLADIGVFFLVLMVGFAYVWKRGDLDWVRSITRDVEEPPPATASAGAEPPQLTISA